MQSYSVIIPPNIICGPGLGGVVDSENFAKALGKLAKKISPAPTSTVTMTMTTKSTKIRPRREMGFLGELLDSSMNRDKQIYDAILEHPIVHLFSDIKWNRLKFLYFMY